MGSTFSSDKISSPINELNQNVKLQESKNNPIRLDSRLKITLYNQILPHLQTIIDQKEINQIKQLNKRIIDENRLTSYITAPLTAFLIAFVYSKEKRYLTLKRKHMAWFKYIKYVPLTVLFGITFHYACYNIFASTSQLTTEINQFMSIHSQILNKEVIKLAKQQAMQQDRIFNEQTLKNDNQK